MSPIPAGKIFAQLGSESKPAEAVAPWPGRLEVRTAASAALPASTPASKIDEAYKRGLAAGRAAILAEIETRLEAERTYYTQQLQLERYTWANREGDRLAAQIAKGLDEIRDNVAEVTARILKPFLAEAAHRQAIDELLEAMEILLGKNQGITLEIFGPEDLLQLIREKLAGRNIAALFAPEDGVDVRVIAGQTVLETNLAAWMDELRRQ